MIAIPKRQKWIAFLNPIFWEAAFGVATWSVAAYVAILFVAWMRPLLERLLLTYAVGAIFTLLMQTYARFDQCVGIVACTFSFAKGVVWSTIWPVAWIIGVGRLMALTMRPTGLGSGIDKDRQDYTVYTGGWGIGRIYEVRGGPDHLRWFWSFTLHGPMTRSDRVATLEEAKAQFQKSWDAWKAWAKLEEVP